MKRIKSVNGYTIYQATTQRDADNYGCDVGSYNVYLSSDIRDFGLTNSYPEYDNLDSLTYALVVCNSSRYAVAAALADELSQSTAQDMDLTLAIEQRLDAGEAVSYVRDCYDPETGILHAEPAENPYYLDSDHTWLDDVVEQYVADCHADDDDELADDDVDPDAVIDALATGELDGETTEAAPVDWTKWTDEFGTTHIRTRGYEVKYWYEGITCYHVEKDGEELYHGWTEDGVLTACGFDPFEIPENAFARYVYQEEESSMPTNVSPYDIPENNWYTSVALEGSLRQCLITGIGTEDIHDQIESTGLWGMAVLELGYSDIEVNITHEGDRIFAEYFICLKKDDGDWFSHGYIDRYVSIDWTAANWKDLLHEEMRSELLRYAAEHDWDLTTPFVDESYAAWTGLYAAEQCPVEPEQQPAPKQERSSHASYYVIETCDSDCQWLTIAPARPAELTDEQYRNLFFRKLAERIAFEDCSDEQVNEIVYDGERVQYVGWQPGMLIEFASCETGEIVYSGSFPEWDH